MANLCIKTPSSATYVLKFQLLVLRPRPNGDGESNGDDKDIGHDDGGVDSTPWRYSQLLLVIKAMVELDPSE